MQPSPPTQPKTFRKSWAVSKRHIKNWAENQPEENVGHGSGCGLTSKDYNLGAWTGVFTWLRLPVLWLDNLWYSSSVLRTKQAHRQGCYYHFQPDQESMVQQEADAKYQNPGLQSLCFEHAAVRQWVLDHICSLCGKDCHSRIGLFSHKRRCSRTTNQSAT